MSLPPTKSIGMHYNSYAASLPNSIRIAYIDQPAQGREKGVVLLLHGFPQTSYQFRNVIPLISSAGYRVVAPDYRGAGLSSKPDGGFTKPVMAADMAQLLDCLNITQSVHLVGHDIGGMIAYAFASRFPERTASVNWGECPLPGTSVHDEDRSADQQFHFLFHSVLDLLEALVIDREDIYLNHFFGKLLYNTSSISSQDLDHYVRMYSQPGALRCAFNIYRVFLQDAEENHAWIACHSKCKVRALGLSGAKSRHKETAGRMFAEVHEASTFRVAEVPASGHYIADQNPNGFSKAVVDFIEEDAV